MKPNSGTYGSSGVVYTGWGVVSGYAIFNGLSSDPETKRFHLLSKNKVKRTWAFVNLITIVSFVLYLAVDPSLFLSEAPGVNVFAHGIGFLGGFFATFAYRLFCKNPQLRDIPIRSKKQPSGTNVA